MTISVSSSFPLKIRCSFFFNKPSAVPRRINNRLISLSFKNLQEKLNILQSVAFSDWTLNEGSKKKESINLVRLIMQIQPAHDLQADAHLYRDSTITGDVR